MDSGGLASVPKSLLGCSVGEQSCGSRGGQRACGRIYITQGWSLGRSFPGRGRAWPWRCGSRGWTATFPMGSMPCTEIYPESGPVLNLMQSLRWGSVRPVEGQGGRKVNPVGPCVLVPVLLPAGSSAPSCSDLLCASPMRAQNTPFPLLLIKAQTIKTAIAATY